MDNIQNSIRVRAARRMVWSGAPALLLVWLFLSATKPPHYFTFMTALAAACVPFVADLAQVVSGVRFREMACRWERLKSWQSLALGLMIVLMFIAAIFVIVNIVTISR